jgi:hypothetical protein
MLRKILLACCLVGFSVGILGCPEAPKKDTGKAAPAAAGQKAEAKPGARPVAPPHNPGNS